MKDARVEVSVVRQWPANMSWKAVRRWHKANRITARRVHRESYRQSQRQGGRLWQMRLRYSTFRPRPRKRPS